MVMASENNQRPIWAKLIFNHDVYKDPVEIRENRFVIGRSPGCSLNLRDNKHVSAQHCAIEKTADGRVLIADLSANGTLINGTEKIGKGKTKEVTDGTIVYLVKKKNQPAADLGFTVKLIQQREEYDRTLAYTPDLEIGQQKTPASVKATRSTSSSGSVDGQPAAKRFRPAESTTGQNDPSTSKEAGTSSAAASGSVPSTRPKPSAIADNLLCSICFDILHDCISLQPCMHCFCAGCYSDWMSRSGDCPDCRVKVTGMNKNHVMNNVVNAYLAEHPEKKRSDDEIKELDAKNKITPEMLKSRSTNRKRDIDNHGSDCSCSECEDNAGSSDESNDGDRLGQIVNAVAGGLAARFAPPQHIVYAGQCRQCPGYRGFPVLNARVRPQNPHARPCPFGQIHVMCQCCFSNMPDRRNENNPALPPIECVVCHQTFCDMVFGCSRAGCVGCLARFKETKFPDAVFNDIFGNNVFEANVLKTYLTRKNKSWGDVLKECMEKMDRNEYRCVDKAIHNLTSESPLCQTCALRNFRELAYQFRQNIPNNDFPAEITRRPDCYWGKNCRTQRKYEHAARYNHICEQTKF